MGEKQNDRLQLSFNASLKIDFRGSRVLGSMVRRIAALPTPAG
jgi:hypothetical protein